MPKSNLENLRSGFAHGSLKYEVTPGALLQSGVPAGQEYAVSEFLNERSWGSDVVAAVIDTILDTRDESLNVSLTQSLVVTGPEVPQKQILKTGSRFLQVVDHAKRELMVATFALYQGDKILEPIYQAMLRNEDLDVVLILNVQRGYGDTTQASQLVDKCRHDFLSKHWKWDLKPRVYYFPGSLELSYKLRGVMHAKFLIADEERAFVTSANFTEAAQQKNIEVGVELANSIEPKALSRYFKELIESGCLEKLL